MLRFNKIHHFILCLKKCFIVAIVIAKLCAGPEVKLPAENQEHTDPSVGVFLEKDFSGNDRFVFDDPNAGTPIVCEAIEQILGNEIERHH